MHHISDVVLEIDTLMKDITDIDIVGLYQDKNHAVELSHKDGIFYVRLDGANLYAGSDGSKATSMFYDQIAQIHDFYLDINQQYQCQLYLSSTCLFLILHQKYGAFSLPGNPPPREARPNEVSLTP